MAIPQERINLKVTSIVALRHHEETVENITEGVLRALVRDGVQRDPVVADATSGTILDGAHRVEALRRAGAKSVLTYLLEYRDPRVHLYRWYRLVRDPGAKRAQEILTELGLETLGPIGSADLAAAPHASVRVLHRGSVFGKSAETMDGSTGTMRLFDSAAATRGLRVEFIDEGSASGGLPRGDDLVLIPPRFVKEDVLGAGASGKLFPPKSTLHVFPFRPLGVRYPLEDLRAGRDVLEEVLRSRRPRRVDSPSSHFGRDYREAVVVFD